MSGDGLMSVSHFVFAYFALVSSSVKGTRVNLEFQYVQIQRQLVLDLNTL